MANKSKIVGAKYYTILVLIMVLVVAISFATPPNQASLDRYNLSAIQARLLGLTLQIPLFAIWTVALFGFVRTKKYAHKIKGDADGKAFDTLANGLGVLAFSLPISSVYSGISNFLTRQHLEWIPVTHTVSQYISLSFSFVALYLICKGAKGLAQITKTKVRKLGEGWQPILYGVTGITYAYFVLTNSVKRIAPTATSRATFYLPDWAIATTILLPYLIAWYFGIMAVYYLALYRKNVAGQLYQGALKSLGIGVGFVVSLSILLQLLGVFGTQLQGLDLKALLGIIYFLIIFIAIGYVFIARGAKKLKKIEEV